jgi:hypothetical protein
MTTLSVVEYFDVIKKTANRLFSGFVSVAVCPLDFEQTKETLGNGVVIAIACPNQS